MSKHAFLCALLLYLSLSLRVQADELSAEQPLEPVAWNWKAVSDLHDAIVKVSLGKAIGTGVIVRVEHHKPSKGGYEGYCLTALHVVESADSDLPIKITYKSGRRSKNCSIVHRDQEHDLALLWVWVPDGVKPVPVAKEPARPHQLLEFSGLGGGEELKCCLRNFTGYAADPTKPETIFANVSLLPGDSGGPIFNKKGGLVGVISGGWFWWDGGAKSSKGEHVQATWPARGANLEALESALAQIDACQECDEATETVAISDSTTRR